MPAWTFWVTSRFENYDLQMEKKKLHAQRPPVSHLSSLLEVSIRGHRAERGNNKVLSCRAVVGSGPESTSVTAVSPEKADRKAKFFFPVQQTHTHAHKGSTRSSRRSHVFRLRRKQLFNGVLQRRRAECWRTGRQNTSAVFNHPSRFLFFFSLFFNLESSDIFLAGFSGDQFVGS